MTTVEPWSGHYEVNPVIWATAHFGTQDMFFNTWSWEGWSLMFLWGDKIVTKVVETTSETIREISIWFDLCSQNLITTWIKSCGVIFKARYPIHGGGLEVFVERQRLGWTSQWWLLCYLGGSQLDPFHHEHGENFPCLALNMWDQEWTCSWLVTRCQESSPFQTFVWNVSRWSCAVHTATTSKLQSQGGPIATSKFLSHDCRVFCCFFIAKSIRILSHLFIWNWPGNGNGMLSSIYESTCSAASVAPGLTFESMSLCGGVWKNF